MRALQGATRMKKVLYFGWSGLVLLLGVAGCDGGNDGAVTEGRRLRYILTDESTMSQTIDFGRPRDERTLTGEMEVVVKERSTDHIVFEVESMRLASVEDDFYEVSTTSGGTIRVGRNENIEAAVDVSVNGMDQGMFRGALNGQNRPVILDSEPPVLRGVGLRNDRGSSSAGHTAYFITIFATVDGRPVPTPEPIN